MIELKEKEIKELEEKCYEAVKQNNITLFDLTFTFMNKNINFYPYFLGYKLLQSLLKSREEFYFLVETIENFEDKYIKFVFEVEKAFNLRNKRKLQQLKEKMPEYNQVLSDLIDHEIEFGNKNENEEKKERNVEMINECLYILENYNKI